MGIEIERKFLLKNRSYRDSAYKSCEIKQGYLSREPERVVRVRIRDNKGFITIKGKTIRATRLEFEYEVLKEDAEKLLLLCNPPILSKTRFYFKGDDNLIWEIDEFHGEREGLVVAEVELKSEDHPVSIPAFIGNEVTGDPQYYNSNL